MIQRQHCEVVSPLGRLRIAAEGESLVALDWLPDDAPPTPAPDLPVLRQAAEQLAAYFDGQLSAFTLPLRPFGSAHQQAVWRALSAIPYGETVTYGALAAEVGSIARAVGTACGANPLPIIVPCHRVLASGGLGGFSARGGLDTKRWLLAHEGAAQRPRGARADARQAELF